MAVDLNQIAPELTASIEKIFSRCRACGIVMRSYFALRSPLEQAKLWRQSRSIEEINEKIGYFKRSDAPFLANCIQSVGPQHGDPVTNVAPVFSWHQWGEVVDCFWLVNRQAEWSAIKKIAGQNGYQIYVAEAKRLNLTPGGYWHILKDWPLVQLRAASDPGETMSLVEIDAAMKAKFGS